ncbi:MAG: metallopeptidase family protein [Planctomycetota bacterium]|nr:metallopeptidase family protein [Planctomycetota bacterium]
MENQGTTGEPKWSGWDEEEAGPEDEALDRAWTAIDAGDPEAALRELESVDADWPDRWIPEGIARTDLGDLAGARAALDRVREAADVDDHPDWLWAEGCLLLAEWRIGEARAVLEKLAGIERTVGVLERLSVAHEIQGDFAGADQLVREAHAIDPDALPIPPRFEHADFERITAAAVEALPAEFRSSLENTEIVVESVPSEWMIDLADPAGTPPDLLGLFVGTSRLDAAEDSTAELPPRIFLFQRNLERASRDEAELVEQIRTTLYHEIGHLLGFDEEGVAAMGLE